MSQWSEECDANGTAQCDGYIYGGEHDGEWCACPCHNTATFRSLEEAKVWHDKMHGLDD